MNTKRKKGPKKEKVVIVIIVNQVKTAICPVLRTGSTKLFSYLGNGINPKDIACLKYKNIESDHFLFERAKAEKATRSDPKPISVYITKDMQVILDRWASKDKNPNNYVFPILEPGITALRQYELIELFIRSINDWLVKIRKKLKIERR